MFGELIIGLQGSPQHLEKSTTTKNKDKNSCKIKRLFYMLYIYKKHKENGRC